MQYLRIAFRGAAFGVVTVDLGRDDLRLFWRNPAAGRRFGSLGGLAAWARSRGQRLEFATNAGIFAPHHRPLGLYVEEGRVVTPLNGGDGDGNFYLKPNGVFAVGAGRAAVVPTAEYGRLGWPVRFATQSGPLLVSRGKVHPAFRDGSRNRTVRSGVGIVSPTRVAFALSDGNVNFMDFALLFRDRLGCRDALYLDGGISRLYCPAGGRTDAGGDFAAMIGVLAPGKERAPDGR